MSIEKKIERKKMRHSNRMLSRMVSPIRSQFYMKTFRFIRWSVGVIIILLLTYFILAGGINQRKTFDTAKNMFTNIGQNVGYFLNSLFGNNSPVDINEDGVYIKGADIPDNGAIDKSAETMGGDPGKITEKNEDTSDATSKDNDANVSQDESVAKDG